MGAVLSYFFLPRNDHLKKTKKNFLKSKQADFWSKYLIEIMFILFLKIVIVQKTLFYMSV